MKATSKAIYIVSAFLIAALIAFVICGALLFVKEDAGSVGPTGNDGHGVSSSDIDSSGEIDKELYDPPVGVSPEEVLLFRAKTDRAGRLWFRNRSFGDYTGKGWTTAEEYEKPLLPDRGMNYLVGTTMLEMGEGTAYVVIEPQGTQSYLPYYPYTEGDEDYPPMASDVAYGDAEGTMTVKYIPPTAERYAAGRFAEEEKEYREFVYEHYLDVPQETAAVLKNILEEADIRAEQEDVVERVALYVRTAAKYDKNYDGKLDASEDIVVAFLTQYKTGVCRHYASAATLLYRTLGIPARYTIGCVSDMEADRWTDVTGLCAHAWTEVYLDGVGWIQMEVTGGYNGSLSAEDAIKFLEEYGERKKKETEDFFGREEVQKEIDDAVERGKRVLRGMQFAQDIEDALKRSMKEIDDIVKKYNPRCDVVFAHMLEGVEYPEDMLGVPRGSLIEIPALDDYESEGKRYVFMGWSEKEVPPLLSDPSAAAGYDLLLGSYFVNNSVTLYGVWRLQKTYNVTLVSGTEGEILGETKLPLKYEQVSERAEIPLPEQLTLTVGETRHLLYGWSPEERPPLQFERDVPDELYRSRYFVSSEDAKNGEIVLYAVWATDSDGDGTPDLEELYTVLTVNESEGEVTPETGLEKVYRDLSEGDRVVLPQEYVLRNATRYFLLGWSLQKGGAFSQPPDFDYLTAGEEYVVRGEDAEGFSICLRAVWAKDANANGIADWDETAYTLRFNDETKLAATLPDRIEGLVAGVMTALPDLAAPAGYLFLGWTTQPYLPVGYKEDIPEQYYRTVYLVNKEDAVGDEIVFFALWAKDSNSNRVPDYRERYDVQFKNVAEGTTEGFPEDVEQILCGEMTLPGEGALLRSEEGESRLVGWVISFPAKSVFGTWEELPYDMRAPGDSVYVSFDIVFYAIWRKNEQPITVRTRNVAEGEVSPSQGLEQEHETWEGAQVALGKDFSLDRENKRYILFGWSFSREETLLDREPSFEYFTAGGIYTVRKTDAAEGAVTFYALWAEDFNNNGTFDWEEPRYTLRFVNETAVQAELPEPVEGLLSGTEIELPRPQIPQDVQYAFYGWALYRSTEVYAEMPSFEVLRGNYTVAAEQEGETSVLFYAVWAEDFNSNGIPDWQDNLYFVRYLHTLSEDPIDWPSEQREILTGTEITLPGLYEYGYRFQTERDGKTFTLTGWTETPLDDGFYTEYPPSLKVLSAGGPYTVEHNTELYAVWISEQSVSDPGDSGAIGGGPQLPSVALRLRSDHTGKIYLRTKSFGNYGGQAWSGASVYPYVMKHGNGVYGANYLAGEALGENGYTSWTVTVMRATGLRLYYLPTYLATDGGDYDVPLGDVAYTGSAGVYTAPYYAFSVFGGELPQRSLNAAYEKNYRAFVKQNYLSVRESTAAGLNKIIEENDLRGGDVLETVEKVARYVSHAATYDQTYDPALDGSNDIVLAFLNEYRRGVCTHYASAATLIYRLLGIPARYVTGFVGTTIAGRETEVTMENAHAWVEVYLDGFGWAQVEVTGPGGSAANDFDNEMLEQEKQAAKDELFEYGERKKQELDGRDDLTEEQKQAAKEQIGGIVEGGMGAIDEADSSGEVKERLAASKGAVDEAAENAGKAEEENDLAACKQRAKDELDAFAREKKQELDGRGDLTAEKKEGLKEKIDEALERGKAAIDRAQSPGEAVVAQKQAEKEIEDLLASTKRRIVLYTDDLSAEYDGTEHSARGYHYTGDLGGRRLQVETPVAVKNVGSAVNAAVYHIWDEYGKDVTDEYEVVCKFGTIRITPRKLTLRAGSASKRYDGSPLVCADSEIVGGELAQGDHIVAETAGTLTNRGRTANRIVSVHIYNAAGVEVTANYILETQDGTLTVN